MIPALVEVLPGGRGRSVLGAWLSSWLRTSNTLPFHSGNAAMPSIAFGVGNPSSIGSPSLLMTRYWKPRGNARSSPAASSGP